MNNIVCNNKSDIYPYIFLLSIVLFTFFYKRTFKQLFYNHIAAFMVLIGGTLNFLEWLYTGCVRDYIRFFHISLYNINDLLIVLGTVFLVIMYIYDSKKR